MQKNEPSLKPKTILWDKYAWAIFLLLAFSYGYFYYNDGNDNVNSRLGLVLAIVNEGRVTIDSYHDQPLTRTIDKAFYKGHYYSEKALGTAILGTLVYWPIHTFEQWFDWKIDFFKTRHIITFFTVGLPSALSGALLYILCFQICKDRIRSYVITLGITFGTMIFPFSTIFFGHSLAAAFLFIAFFLVFQINNSKTSPKFGYMVLVGGALGFAPLTEYPTIVIAIGIAFYYLYCVYPNQTISIASKYIAPVIGGSGVVSLYFLYNWICFGSPFTNAYSHLAMEEFQQVHGHGFLGIGLPEPLTFFYMTIHPIRGIFMQSPILIMSLLGLIFLRRNRKYLAEGIVAAYALLVLLVVISGYPQWWGGWTFGPRHLIPMLPFMGIPLLFLPVRWFWLIGLLTLISIVHMVMVTVTGPLIPDTLLYAIYKGKISVEILPFFGTSPIYGVALDAFLNGKFLKNAGMLLHLRGINSLLPLLIVFIGMSVLISYWNRSERRNKRNVKVS